MFLLDNGVSADKTAMPSEAIPAIKALSLKKTDIVKLILPFMHDQAKKEKVLAFAIQEGEIDIAGQLLNSGLNSDVKDGYGQTLLQLSIFNKHPNITKLLISHKADVNYLGELGVTPLYLAMQEEEYDIAHELLKAGADVNKYILVRGALIAPMIMAVIAHENYEMTKILILSGAHQAAMGSLLRGEDEYKVEMSAKMKALLLVGSEIWDTVKTSLITDSSLMFVMLSEDFGAVERSELLDNRKQAWEDLIYTYFAEEMYKHNPKFFKGLHSVTSYVDRCKELDIPAELPEGPIVADEGEVAVIGVGGGGSGFVGDDSE